MSSIAPQGKLEVGIASHLKTDHLLLRSVGRSGTVIVLDEYVALRCLLQFIRVFSWSVMLLVCLSAASVV